MNIGFIGHKNHARKLISLVAQTINCDKITVYYPDLRKLTNNFSAEGIPCGISLTSKLEDIFESDAVFIASPTDTHCAYLNILNEQFHGYVFCEKPPCNNLDELRVLRGLDGRKIFFNFNYRYSKFAKICKTAMKTGEFGVPISLNCCGILGLAFNTSFSVNWRNLSESILENVIGNAGIHYVDLASYLLGKAKKVTANYQKISPHTKICDTAMITVETESGLPTSILISYAAPYRVSLQMIFSDAIVDFLNGTLSVQRPRDSFDDAGFYVPPPERLLIPKSKADISQSLKSSVSEFFKVVEKSSFFPPELFNSGLDSTNLLLSLPWAARHS